MSVKLNVASDVISLAKGLAVIRAFDNFISHLAWLKFQIIFHLVLPIPKYLRKFSRVGYLSKIIQTTPITHLALPEIGFGFSCLR